MMRTRFGTRPGGRPGNVPDATPKVVGTIGRLNASRGAVDGTVEQVVSDLRSAGPTGAIPPLPSRGPALRVRPGLRRRQIGTPLTQSTPGLYLPSVRRAARNPASDILHGEAGARRYQGDACSPAGKVPFPGVPTAA